MKKTRFASRGSTDSFSLPAELYQKNASRNRFPKSLNATASSKLPTDHLSNPYQTLSGPHQDDNLQKIHRNNQLKPIENTPYATNYFFGMKGTDTVSKSSFDSLVGIIDQSRADVHSLN